MQNEISFSVDSQKKTIGLRLVKLFPYLSEKRFPEIETVSFY